MACSVRLDRFACTLIAGFAALDASPAAAATLDFSTGTVLTGTGVIATQGPATFSHDV